MTSNQVLARALLAACLAMAFLSFGNSLLLAALDRLSGWVDAVAAIARVVPPSCLLVACILGLLRTRRSRLWIRAATSLVILRELGLVGAFAYTVLTDSEPPAPSFVAAAVLMNVTFAAVVIILAGALFLQAGHREVGHWLERRPRRPLAGPATRPRSTSRSHLSPHAVAICPDGARSTGQRGTWGWLGICLS